MAGSSETPKRVRYQSAAALRNANIPSYEGYWWFLGSAAAAARAWIIWGGVGRSGSPIPKLMTSTPFFTCSCFIRSSSANR